MSAIRLDTDFGQAADEHAFGQQARRDLRPVPRITIQAFCETHETAAAFENARADRCLSRAHLKIQRGGIDAAIEQYREAPTPNLVLLETTERREELMRHLMAFSEVCDPSTRVVLIGHVNDVVLYRDLVRQGISEYVVAPVEALDLVEVISNLYADPNAKPLGRMVAFVGAKGGVGASTVAHNVAWSTANDLTLDTLVADLDLAFGTANLDFNTDPPQGIAEAVFSPDRLDQNFLDRLMASCSDHLNLLAAPATLDRTYDFGETAFEQTMDLARNNAPLIVLDVPHVWTAWSKKTLLAADEVVVVAAPDLANLRNAKNMIDLLRTARPHDPPPKLVLNQVGMPKRPEIPAVDFAKALDVPPATVIPFDAALFGTAANNGQLVVEAHKASKVADALRGLALTVSGRPSPRKAKAGLLSPLMGKVQGLISRKG